MNKLEISEIQIIPVKPHNGLVAFASCVLNQGIYVGNIAVYTSPSSSDGFRLVYPLKTLPTGKQVNCVHPINRETGETIKKAIISKYMELMEKFQKG
ncbi:septation protein SpoVG family protein [Candidatus Omnitrophota bacterium]